MLRTFDRWSVALLAVFLAVAGCRQNGDGENPSDEGNTQPAPEASTAAGYRNISVEQLHSMMERHQFLLVNVHIPFEGDIPGTDESIPFDRIADHLDQLPNDRDSEIVLYCRSGRMSEEAAQTLTSLGFTHVLNLDGGFRAWEAAGYELEGVGTSPTQSGG